MLQTATQMKTDVLLISEQYNSLNKVNWYEDESKRAGIVVPEMGVTAYDTQQTGFVWVELAGVRVYSCYFSPSVDLPVFDEELSNLEDSLETARGEILITGDFNAKSPEWGEHRLDTRGQMVCELLTRWHLKVANNGEKPTFVRNEAESILDLTLTTENMERCIGNWRVLDEESLSDHCYISFEVEQRQATERNARTGTQLIKRAWNVKSVDWRKFEETLKCSRLLDELDWVQRSHSLNGLVLEAKKKISEACLASMPKRRAGFRGADKYWWTAEIAELRRMCMTARRRYTRSRGDEALKSELKRARSTLKKAIRSSQRRCWNELIELLEEDPWGFAYRVVFKKLRCRQKIVELTDKSWVKHVIVSLFPRHPVRRVARIRCHVEPNLLFTQGELIQQWGKLKNGKSPGPDGIPNEAIKRVIKVYPELLLRVYNKCLLEGVFYKQWKRQRLILLRKGKKPLDQPSSYRPLCLLDTMGKVLEGLILKRLQDFVDQECPFSDNQYGFRRGKTTIDAIREVTRMAQQARDDKVFCALIGIDIRNAFNSLRWKDINKCFKKRRIPLYLRRMVRDYLSGRRIIFTGDQWVIEDEMTAGAPQGSRLGPFLWTMVFDSLLTARMPRGTKLIGFADDTIIVVLGREIEILRIRVDESLYRVRRWLAARGLEMAVQKTEAVLVTRRRAFEWPEITLGDQKISWTGSMTYLGVVVDRHLNFGRQVNEAALKGLEAGRTMSKLMPNVRGPREKKRRLIATSIMSKVMYAAPAWEKAMDKACHRARLQSVQRLVALRIVSGYRTVSTAAALVLASLPPVDLLVRESRERYDGTRGPATTQETVMTIRREARRTVLQEWQRRWQEEVTGRWTFCLIPNLDIWISRKYGEVDFYLTQALTGHGYFREYLHRFKHAMDARCVFCCAEVDDAKHTLFECERFSRTRYGLYGVLGLELGPQNFEEILLSSEENWKKVAEYVTAVMKIKEATLRNARP